MDDSADDIRFSHDYILILSLVLLHGHELADPLADLFEEVAAHSPRLPLYLVLLGGLCGSRLTHLQQLVLALYHLAGID